ncbi:MAG: MFS transporter, partial [Chitinophagaceae bacterium]|nr:MFS transporter [Chitinophagaceae bacterium]
GVGGVSVASYTLLSEVWPQKTKPIFIGILSIAFPIGIFSAGLINYNFSSWREGFLVGAIPILLALIGSAIIKESDKWLEEKKNNPYKENTFKTIFSDGHRKDIISSSLIYGTMLI